MSKKVPDPISFNMKLESKEIFRWLVVLPGALISGFLALFPLHWVLYMTLSNSDGITGGELELLPLVETFLSPIVSMVVFILVGYRIAPKYKIQTSFVLAGLWVIVILYGVIFNPFGISIFIDTRTIFTFVGIIIALYINWVKFKKENIEK